jgi:endonuclease/exonuclease/phosphatase family metal-dependent hydrolase
VKGGRQAEGVAIALRHDYTQVEVIKDCVVPGLLDGRLLAITAMTPSGYKIGVIVYYGRATMDCQAQKEANIYLVTKIALLSRDMRAKHACESTIIAGDSNGTLDNADREPRRDALTHGDRHIRMMHEWLKGTMTDMVSTEPTVIRLHGGAHPNPDPTFQFTRAAPNTHNMNGPWLRSRIDHIFCSRDGPIKYSPIRTHLGPDWLGSDHLVLRVKLSGGVHYPNEKYSTRLVNDKDLRANPEDPNCDPEVVDLHNKWANKIADNIATEMDGLNGAPLNPILYDFMKAMQAGMTVLPTNRWGAPSPRGHRLPEGQASHPLQDSGEIQHLKSRVRTLQKQRSDDTRRFARHNNSNNLGTNRRHTNKHRVASAAHTDTTASINAEITRLNCEIDTALDTQFMDYGSIEEEHTGSGSTIP